MTRSRMHPVFAAAYDPVTRSLERTVPRERRARPRHPDPSFKRADCFDSFPRLVPSRPLLEAVARPAGAVS